MNKEFLYTKPYVSGIIDDTVVELESWFLDDSRDRMEQELRSISLSDLIIKLINIFKGGEPNYQVLLSLLGRKMDKEVQENKNVYSLREILRSDEDIKRIEIEVDNESLNIKQVRIYVDIISFVTFEKEEIITNVDLRTEKTSDTLSLFIQGKSITLIGL
ncbi:hypothetical protein [Paenibacillus sp. 7516]|uniref:hypothetical protein n=1 Tax=Paenibacillus sp. 7516 TaxID=2022549 RepID=UPI000BA7A593|nr:hypothetical protein [Paenibacillus sp. 7516]PAF31253.1 hypothetical protein CHI14_12050 [Paenibacillus sp. 7516]